MSLALFRARAFIMAAIANVIEHMRKPTTSSSLNEGEREGFEWTDMVL